MMVSSILQRPNCLIPVGLRDSIGKNYLTRHNFLFICFTAYVVIFFSLYIYHVEENVDVHVLHVRRSFLYYATLKSSTELDI